MTGAVNHALFFAIGRHLAKRGLSTAGMDDRIVKLLFLARNVNPVPHIECLTNIQQKKRRSVIS